MADLERDLLLKENEIVELKNQIEDMIGEKSIILKKSQNVNHL